VASPHRPRQDRSGRSRRPRALQTVGRYEPERAADPNRTGCTPDEDPRADSPGSPTGATARWRRQADPGGVGGHPAVRARRLSRSVEIASRFHERSVLDLTGARGRPSLSRRLHLASPHRPVKYRSLDFTNRPGQTRHGESHAKAGVGVLRRALTKGLRVGRCDTRTGFYESAASRNAFNICPLEEPEGMVFVSTLSRQLRAPQPNNPGSARSAEIAQITLPAALSRETREQTSP
jgi:hypothetical protein